MDNYYKRDYHFPSKIAHAIIVVHYNNQYL